MSNHQISQWRRHRVEEYPASDDLPDTAVWDEDTERVEMRTVLGRAVAALPVRDREVLALRYYGAYTDTEIAERLGLSVGTVKSTLWRALRKLRENGAVPDCRGSRSRLTVRQCCAKNIGVDPPISQ